MHTPETEPGLYLLQDSRGNIGDNLSFWAANGGYTTDVRAAERFSAADAFGQNQSRATDIPWPAPYIEARTRLVVDMQHIRPAESISFLEVELFYLQHGREYVGNDILFVPKTGDTPTPDLSQAKLFAWEDATAYREGRDVKTWPKMYLDNKRRPGTNFRNLSLKKALGKEMSKLRKVKPMRTEQYRCCGCGVFMNVVSYYSGDCVRCGADSRP